MIYLEYFIHNFYMDLNYQIEKKCSSYMEGRKENAVWNVIRAETMASINISKNLKMGI